jgi:hypothetical protein
MRLPLLVLHISAGRWEYCLDLLRSFYAKLLGSMAWPEMYSLRLLVPFVTPL